MAEGISMGVFSPARTIVGTAAAGLLVGGAFLVGAAPANAHAVFVLGTAECIEETGTYAVTWTVSNDYETEATIKVVGHAPVTAPVTFEDLTIDARTGDENPTVTGTQTVPGNLKKASLSVTGTWSDGFKDRKKRGEVTLTGTCSSSPSPSPSPSESESPSPTPTPSESESPSPSASPSESESPSATPTPSESESPSPTPSVSASETGAPSPTPSASPSEGSPSVLPTEVVATPTDTTPGVGGLPVTGSSLGTVLVSGTVLLVLGAGLLMLGRRRRQV